MAQPPKNRTAIRREILNTGLASVAGITAQPSSGCFSVDQPLAGVARATPKMHELVPGRGADGASTAKISAGLAPGNQDNFMRKPFTFLETRPVHSSNN